MAIDSIIKKLRSKSDLTREELSLIVDEFEKKNVTDEDIKKLVIFWQEKKETPNELSNLVDILFSKEKQIETFEDIVDMCGTGGDKLSTFNVSTISAIVTSFCGAKVIKHSGRGTTSVTGSVDVLNHFELDIDALKDVKENCFRKSGLMFVSSRILRDIFGRVKEVCKKMNQPGFVNLLGPLSNPYKTSYHLLGVSKIEWGDLLVSSLKLQDKEKKNKALIVCSKIAENVFMDELSFCGINYVWKLENGEVSKESIDLNSKLGIEKVNLKELVVNDLNESMIVFEDILRGKLSDKDPKANIVALNAGAALYLTNIVKSIPDGYKFALRHINSGKVWEHFQNFINCNKRLG